MLLPYIMTKAGTSTTLFLCRITCCLYPSVKKLFLQQAELHSLRTPTKSVRNPLVPPRTVLILHLLSFPSPPPEYSIIQPENNSKKSYTWQLHKATRILHASLLKINSQFQKARAILHSCVLKSEDRTLYEKNKTTMPR